MQDVNILELRLDRIENDISQLKGAVSVYKTTTIIPFIIAIAGLIVAIVR